MQELGSSEYCYLFCFVLLAADLMRLLTPNMAEDGVKDDDQERDLSSTGDGEFRFCGLLFS